MASLTSVFIKTDVNQLTITSFFGKKPTLYYPLYNIFCAFGISLVSLTTLRLLHESSPLNPLSLSLLWRWNHCPQCRSRSHSRSRSSRFQCHFRSWSHSHNVETSVGTITLAHGLSVTLTLALMVCFFSKLCGLWVSSSFCTVGETFQLSLVCDYGCADCWT